MLNERRRSVSELKSFVAGLAERDPELIAELREQAAAPLPEGIDPAAAAVYEMIGGPESAVGMPELALETIVLRQGRPVLAIQNDEINVVIDDPEAQVLRARLEAARPHLNRVIPAVGRIEVSNNPYVEWVGTGWLIEPEVIVTNRHVALLFGMRDNARFVFQAGRDPARPQAARIDFLEEIGSDAAREFAIVEILYIAPDREPDVALLRVTARVGSSRLAAPIAVARSLAVEGTQVAVIGYPARDSRVPDTELMDRIYGDVYNKKRLAPGQITGHDGVNLLHDCTTLGGNSGSVVLDLATGTALGLHFSGTFLRANYAVPAPVVAQVLRNRPWQGRERPRVPPPRRIPAADRAAAKQTAGLVAVTDAASAVTAGVSAAAGAVCLTIPLEITVRLGAATASSVAPSAPPSVPPGAAPTPAAGDDGIEAATGAVSGMLAGREEVTVVRPGYLFRDGWITEERAVVVEVRPGTPLEPASLGLDETIDGVAIEVRPADPVALTQIDLGVASEAAHQYIANYQRRSGPAFALDAVEERMKVVCHVSPEAGWRELSAFLGATQRELMVAMYDFTAPHVVSAVDASVAPAGSGMTLVIQRGESIGHGTKEDDVPDTVVVARLADALGERFRSAWAPVTGPARLFDSAYHIKVAVRDGGSVWLSSGNWQSSNQPAFDSDPFGERPDPSLLRTYNREWHAIIDSQRLAGLFRAHIEQDYQDARAVPEAPEMPALPDVLVPLAYLTADDEEAPARVRYFPPLTIERTVRLQPLLTPDNYAEHALRLIESARTQVLFQNQSFSPRRGDDQPTFTGLLDALLDRQRAGLDVRIIFRRIGDVRGTLERIQDYGFDMRRVRLQTNCHTKGIVVDEQAVLLGSHNWTTAGTSYNRDASLIFFDPEIARYFARIFEFDWQRIAGVRAPDLDSPALPIAAGVEAVVPEGYARIPWQEWAND